VTAPEDEDREIELMEFTSDKEADILVDYGYRIAVMPTKGRLPKSSRLRKSKRR